MSVNKVILIGHVGQDPEVRYLDNNIPVCTIRMATSDVYKNKSGERVTTTEWHNIVVWRTMAEVAEKTVKKGSQLYVVGKIKTRSYVDKDGNNKYITEILADTFLVLDKKQGSAPEAPQNDIKRNTTADRDPFGPEINEPPAGYQSASEDDLPF